MYGNENILQLYKILHKAPVFKLLHIKFQIHTVLGFKAGGYGMVEAHAKLNSNSYYYAFDYKGLFTTYGIAFGVSEVPGSQINCLSRYIVQRTFTRKLSCNYA